MWYKIVPTLACLLHNLANIVTDALILLPFPICSQKLIVLEVGRDMNRIKLFFINLFSLSSFSSLGQGCPSAHSLTTIELQSPVSTVYHTGQLHDKGLHRNHHEVPAIWVQCYRPHRWDDDWWGLCCSWRRGWRYVWPFFVIRYQIWKWKIIAIADFDELFSVFGSIEKSFHILLPFQPKCSTSLSTCMMKQESFTLSS